MEILTANELLSGAVVYPDADGNWQPDINKAQRFGPDDADARDAVLKAATVSGRLVGIEIEKIDLVDGKVVAQRLRERIRANGPTAPYDNRRQDLGEDGHVSL